MSARAIIIRSLESADRDTIVAVDEKLSGQTRTTYWGTRLDAGGIDLVGVDPAYRGRGVGPGTGRALRRQRAGAARDRQGRDPDRLRAGRCARALHEPGLPTRTDGSPGKARVSMLEVSTGAEAQAPEPYRVGAIFSITGPGSSLGVPERDTAQMLEAEINGKGGVKGPDGRLHPLKVVIYDDASDETKAVLAAKKLIDEDRVAAIVGTTLSGTSLAILDTVQKAQVPMVSCAAAAKIVEPAAERKWIFKTPQSDALIVGALAEHPKARGLTRVGWLNVDYAFGQQRRGDA